MKLFCEDIIINELPDIALFETWNKKIVDSIKSQKDFPRIFKINSSFVHPKSKDLIFVAESKKNKKKIAFSEFTLRFILGEELRITENCGFSFNEFLPMTNTEILITSTTTLSNVQPARFELAVEDVILPQDRTHCLLLSFVINLLNGGGFTNLRYYTRKSHIANWKLVHCDDVSCMTSYEKMFRETFIHKQLVIESAKILGKYLNGEGAPQLATQLMERAYIHDNSKLSNEEELIALSRIRNNNSLKDANDSLSEIEKESVLLHYKNNTHHPEHYESPLYMTRLDILEMCCDWHARSIEKGTSFLEFIETRLKNRFNFPDFMYLEILEYCKFLNNGGKKKNYP